ncbi:MAG: transcription antitermination factor NusB [Bacteroidia bacterium]|nr:transcription antitermination factor NusB [Bacteroidia bacterium]
MLNRRHIRIKVMQSIYAMIQSKSDDLIKQEKFLKFSIINIYDLYVLMLSLLLEVRNLAEQHQEIAKKKFLATSKDKNPSRKFIDNQFLVKLSGNASLASYIKDHKLKHWKDDNEYVRLIWDAIKSSDIYEKYINSEKDLSPKEELNFISEIYKEVIAPNDKLFDYFESQNISWVDDIPFVNTAFLTNIKKINAGTLFTKAELYKDKDDEEFASDLFKKTALHLTDFTEDIDKKTPNWDTDRIAEVDLILIKMALTEFVYFPSIPTKVTINEYIEIAKDYSTTKSSFFINGVLDKLLKEYTASIRIQKIGRGLL